MNIWNSEKWKTLYSEPGQKGGISVHYEKGVNSEVKASIRRMVSWLRKEYLFPIKVNVYVKESTFVRATDGDMVYGFFYWPYTRNEKAYGKGKPYIKMGTGDYFELVEEIGRDNAIATILRSLLYTLTHYFQWLNGKELLPRNLERQAVRCSDRILDDYAEIVEHP